MTKRYFTHVHGFGGPSLYVAVPETGLSIIAARAGKRIAFVAVHQMSLTLDNCLQSVSDGLWREISAGDACEILESAVDAYYNDGEYLIVEDDPIAIDLLTLTGHHAPRAIKFRDDDSTLPCIIS